MDQLQLAIEYTRCMLRSGHKPKEIDISNVYDLIERIQDQGVDRGIITETNCNYCKEKVTLLDTSTLEAKDFTAHCNCRRGHGVSKILALRDWRMQPEGVNRGY